MKEVALWGRGCDARDEAAARPVGATPCGGFIPADRAILGGVARPVGTAAIDGDDRASFTPQLLAQLRDCCVGRRVWRRGRLGEGREGREVAPRRVCVARLDKRRGAPEESLSCGGAPRLSRRRTLLFRRPNTKRERVPHHAGVPTGHPTGHGRGRVRRRAPTCGVGSRAARRLQIRAQALCRPMACEVCVRVCCDRIR